ERAIVTSCAAHDGREWWTFHSEPCCPTQQAAIREHCSGEIRDFLLRDLQRTKWQAVIYECRSSCADSYSPGQDHAFGIEWHGGGNVSRFSLRAKRSGSSARRSVDGIHRRDYGIRERAGCPVRRRSFSGTIDQEFRQAAG